MNESTLLQELISRAAAGERDAQQTLLEQYWPIIRHAVRARKARVSARLAQREDTADLEQTAAIKILEALPKHTWQGGNSFAAWIKTLASSEVIDRYRHHHAQKRDAGAETSLSRAEGEAVRRSPESQLDDRNRVSALFEKVSTLKPDQAAAVLMHHMGFSHAEIGESLDCTADAARKLVTRAHSKLIT